MAVTIHQTPESYTPSDNPIVWTFSSDQTAQPNFVYAIKVFVNDVQVATDLAFPTNGIYAYYDASWIASVNCPDPVISDSLLANAANYCTVRITIVERYGNPVADGSSAVGTNITAWKARMLDEDFINWNPGDYTYNAPGRFLHNYPNTPQVRESGEQIRLMFINNLTNIVNFKIELFDSDGAPTVSATVNFTANTFRLLMANLSPKVISDATSINMVDFEQASYYEVSANSEAGLIIQRINIDRSIIYPYYKRLHFLTQWGDIASWSFGLISRRSGSVESHGFRKGFGQWNGSNFEFLRTQGRDVDYAKTVTRQMKCVSDWLTEEQQNWMVLNLYGSPIVYEELIEGSDSYMIRRRVRNQTIEEKIQENDLLFLEEVTIDLPGYNSMTV